MLALELSTVWTVMVQFRFSNERAIPEGIKRKDPETREELEERVKRYPGGDWAIRSVQHCSLERLHEYLKDAGYVLVDAFSQERLDPCDIDCKRREYVVRFVFMRKGIAQISEAFRKARGCAVTALSEMCNTSFWRVDVHRNPLYDDQGRKMPDQHSVCITPTAREPLFHGDGSRVTQWQRDERGRRIGNAPVPIKPKAYLYVSNGAIQIAQTE